MAATGTPTPNLGLRIPLGTDPASVDDINYNSNALDTIIGDVGETPVAGQLGAANNRISAVQAGLAIVCNGNTHAAIESGQFAYVKNHGTLAEGLYRNNTGSTIAANATLSSSNLTADSSGGLNTVYDALNSKIGKYDCSDSSVDVDTLGTGFVYAGSSSANLPEASACFVLTFRNDSSKATQIALKRSGVGMWIRQCSSGNWGNWEKVTTS